MDAGEEGAEGEDEAVEQAGVAYDVNEKFSITTEVRYFGISEQDLENDVFDFKAAYQTWDLLVGAVYRF